MTDFRIQNGGKVKRYVEVNANGQMEVHAIQETESEYINSHFQESYLVYADVTPTGAGDVFCYIKNTHATKILELDWYRIWTADTAEAIDVCFAPTGTPTNTTVIAPVNSTVGSDNEAAGLFYESVDMGGLSVATLYDRLRISGDGKDVVENYPGKIILPKSQAVCFKALNGAIPLEFTVSFHYKDPE